MRIPDIGRPDILRDAREERGVLILRESPVGDRLRDGDRLRQVLGQFQDYRQFNMNLPSSEGYLLPDLLANIRPNEGWLGVLQDLLENPPEWWDLHHDGFFDEAASVLVAEWLRQHPAVVTPYVLGLLERPSLRHHGTAVLYVYLARGRYELPAAFSTSLLDLADHVGTMREEEASNLAAALDALGTDEARKLLLRVQRDLPTGYDEAAKDLEIYLSA